MTTVGTASTFDLTSAFAGLPFSSTDLAQYRQATFEVSRSILGVLTPTSLSEVQACVRRLQDLKVPFYPLSRGCNWGLGSKVPTADEVVVLDLSRLNAIRNFDPCFGTLTVEAGVSFGQVYRYLEEHGSEWYLPAIGGPSSASPVGNTLELGDGIGIGGDRAREVTDFEVVLADGSCVSLGSRAVQNSKAYGLSSDIPGMDFAPLFVQSNLAVVTAMTFFLVRKPNAFHALFFTLKQQRAMEPAIDTIRDLAQRRIVPEQSFAFWSVYKFLASMGQHPGNKDASFEELDVHLPRLFKGCRWLGYLPIYGHSHRHARILRKEIAVALRGKVDMCLQLSPARAWVASLASPLLSPILQIPVKRFVSSFFSNSVALGIPTDMNTRSMYWRKSGPLPGELDPHRDRCGLHWLCHVVPFRGQDVSRVGEIVFAQARKHSFEPNIAFLNPSSRTFRTFIVLTFDRDNQSEEQRAASFVEECSAELIAAGFPAYRLGIQTMDLMGQMTPEYLNLAGTLKKAIDPFGLIAPGRYDATLGIGKDA